MRIGLLDACVELDPPPPPLSLPPQPAASSAAAASAGAHHRSLLIPLLLTPLQTFAAIDCDRSGRCLVLSSANARRHSGPAGNERRLQQDLTHDSVPVAEAF